MPQIITRAQWGARAPQGTLIGRSVTDLRVIHHTTGKTLGDTENDYKRWVRNIQSYHMDTNEWSDIGYNGLIAPDGDFYVGRGLDKIGAHCSGHNPRSCGVAFLGDSRDLTDEAIATFVWFLDEHYPHAGIRGHRELAATSCPGDGLMRFITDYRAGRYKEASAVELYFYKIIVCDGTVVVCHADDLKSKAIEAEAARLGHGDPISRILAPQNGYRGIKTRGAVVASPSAQAFAAWCWAKHQVTAVPNGVFATDGATRIAELEDAARTAVTGLSTALG